MASLAMSSRGSVDRAPSGVWEVMGSFPVGDSDFFFVPRSCHVEYFIFISYFKVSQNFNCNLSRQRNDSNYRDVAPLPILIPLRVIGVQAFVFLFIDMTSVVWFLHRGSPLICLTAMHQDCVTVTEAPLFFQ